jgi:hypothetical protein
MLCFLLLAGMAFTQTKPKNVVKPPVAELKKILTGTDLPYKMINDSIATIPYEGEHIASYQVIIQKISDLYIVYTNLSEAIPGKIDESKYKFLLLQNENYDIVKVTLSGDDNMAYLRADIYKTGINSTLLKRVITQVANVTNIIAGELK